MQQFSVMKLTCLIETQRMMKMSLRGEAEAISKDEIPRSARNDREVVFSGKNYPIAKSLPLLRQYSH